MLVRIMIKNRYYKILLIGSIVLLISISIQPTSAINNDLKIENSETSSESIVTFQSGDILTRKHLIPIIIGYLYMDKEEVEIKNILKDVIKELIFTGEVTIEKIMEFVEDRGLNADGVYIFPEIENIKDTDGELSCYPGNFFANLWGYNSKGSYVRYKTWYLALYGWYLAINGEVVSEKGGHLIGYFGFARSYYDPWSYPPGDYGSIDLKGYSYIAFHGC